MFCKKCGRIVEDNAKFCGKCGTPISVSTNNTINSQSQINEHVENLENQLNSTQNYNQQTQNYSNNNQKYDNIINPDMKKYAIGSIAIPVITIIIYWNIGLTVYIAILLAILGFSWAKKGRLYSKTLSTIGYVLNGILVGMTIFMFVAILIKQFA